MKKICFIAQFPPPIHGLSKAVDTLFSSSINRKYIFEKINITNNKKFLYNLFQIWKSDADLFYFTISQTKFGNIRDLLILKLLEIQKKKCLVHLHGGYYRTMIETELSLIQKKLNYKSIQKLEGAIVLGQSLKGIFYGMLDESKIRIVPNCVDDEYLINDVEFEEKIRQYRKKRIKHILYISNFIPEKGYKYVLEMAKNEADRCRRGEEKKYHFDFAGAFLESEEEKVFRNYIKNWGIESYITYHGIVSGDKKRELLKKSDIFVLLTQYAKEGQPISILEAMGNGMVIITTNHAGIPDVIKNHRNGLMVDKDEIDIINIFNFLENEMDFEKIVKKNRQDIISKHMEKIYIENMLQIYDELVL